MQLRRRFKQTFSLKDRLISFARETREQAERLPAGRERDQLLQKAQQADTTAHLDDWLFSPGLRSPR